MEIKKNIVIADTYKQYQKKHTIKKIMELQISPEALKNINIKSKGSIKYS